MINIVDPSLFFDPFGKCTIEDSYLPLLDQQGKLQFISFRCIDSIPAKMREELNELKKSFEKTHPKPWSVEVMVAFRRLIGKREESLLDAGYGKCYFKSLEIRKVVEDSLEHFNGERYDLHSFVIMPNHVHILMSMLSDYKIENALNSLKKYTARIINSKTGNKGKFWDGQNYCRMIRNQKHYDIVRAYINNNPRYLKEGEFTLKNFK